MTMIVFLSSTLKANGSPAPAPPTPHPHVVGSFGDEVAGTRVVFQGINVHMEH